MTDMKTLVIDGVEYEIIDASVRVRMTSAESNITNLQTGKADNEDIPTNTSDLTNDSGFITSVPVEDVTIDGTSIVSGKIAAIPRASASAAGVVKIDPHTASDAQYLDIYAEKTSGSEVARKVPLLDANNKVLAAQLPAASTSTQGAMSAEDKTKLNGIEAGAEVNVAYTATSPIAIDANNDISLENSGVTAGAYGGVNSDSSLWNPTYKIPSITLDEKGRATSATNSIISYANLDSMGQYFGGLLTGDDYQALYPYISGGGGWTQKTYGSAYYVTQGGFGAVSPQPVAGYASTGLGESVPFIINVMVYIALDSGSGKYWVPARYRTEVAYNSKTASYYTTIYIGIPTEYEQYNYDSENTSYTFHYAIMYEE